MPYYVFIFCAISLLIFMMPPYAIAGMYRRRRCHWYWWCFAICRFRHAAALYHYALRLCLLRRLFNITLLLLLSLHTFRHHWYFDFSTFLLSLIIASSRFLLLFFMPTGHFFAPSFRRHWCHIDVLLFFLLDFTFCYFITMIIISINYFDVIIDAPLDAIIAAIADAFAAAIDFHIRHYCHIRWYYAYYFADAFSSSRAFFFDAIIFFFSLSGRHYYYFDTFRFHFRRHYDVIIRWCHISLLMLMMPLLISFAAACWLLFRHYDDWLLLITPPRVFMPSRYFSLMLISHCISAAIISPFIFRHIADADAFRCFATPLFSLMPLLFSDIISLPCFLFIFFSFLSFADAIGFRLMLIFAAISIWLCFLIDFRWLLIISFAFFFLMTLHYYFLHIIADRHFHYFIIDISPGCHWCLFFIILMMPPPLCHFLFDAIYYYATSAFTLRHFFFDVYYFAEITCCLLPFRLLMLLPPLFHNIITPLISTYFRWHYLSSSRHADYFIFDVAAAAAFSMILIFEMLRYYYAYWLLMFFFRYAFALFRQHAISTLPLLSLFCCLPDAVDIFFFRWYIIATMLPFDAADWLFRLFSFDSRCAWCWCYADAFLFLLLYAISCWRRDIFAVDDWCFSTLRRRHFFSIFARLFSFITPCRRPLFRCWLPLIILLCHFFITSLLHASLLIIYH